MASGSEPPRPWSVVTVGGGHGQSAVLRALVALECNITAITSVADDGGCSGRLRQEFGMPPPGDLRRCLSTLATHRDLARRFEERVMVGGKRRSQGNLALLEAYSRLGSLQAAADWAARLLGCRGRVAPASERPGRLAIYDRTAGVLVGESQIAARSIAPMVVAVHDSELANDCALRAIAEADLILMGPGSFITSTLAALMTGDIALAIVSSPARRIFIHNLVSEGGQTQSLAADDYVRMLKDHLAIASGATSIAVDELRHHAGPFEARGTCFYTALARADIPDQHDPARVARALERVCGLPRRSNTEPPPPPSVAGRTFDEYLARARERLSREALRTP